MVRYRLSHQAVLEGPRSFRLIELLIRRSASRQASSSVEEVAQDTAADAVAESALRMYSKYSIIRHGERVSDEVSQRDGQTKEKEHCDKRRFSAVWNMCVFLRFGQECGAFTPRIGFGPTVRVA